MFVASARLVVDLNYCCAIFAPPGAFSHYELEGKIGAN
jgi:hypothetical protein